MSIESRRLHSHLHTLAEDVHRREQQGPARIAEAVAAEGGLADAPGEVVTDALHVGARALTSGDLGAA